MPPCSIENEYGLRELAWAGPALAALDLSRNAWLATHHAYGLLGGAAARIHSLRSLCLADCPRLQVGRGFTAASGNCLTRHSGACCADLKGARPGECNSRNLRPG